MGVKTTIVPIPCGLTDAKDVCVSITIIPRGAMATAVIFMIRTLRIMEIIPSGIPIGETGNATRFFDPIVNIAQPTGSVKKDCIARIVRVRVEEREDCATSAMTWFLLLIATNYKIIYLQIQWMRISIAKNLQKSCIVICLFLNTNTKVLQLIIYTFFPSIEIEEGEINNTRLRWCFSPDEIWLRTILPCYYLYFIGSILCVPYGTRCRTEISIILYGN